MVVDMQSPEMQKLEQENTQNTERDILLKK